MNLGKGGQRLSEWMNEGNHTHTHNNNNKMKPTLSWTFLPRKRVHCLQKWEKAIELSHYSKPDGHFTVIAWMMDLLWTQEGPKSPPIVKFCFWNLAGGAQQTDIIHSFTLWNGSLVYPYSIILNNVCPHRHLHFLTSLQLASFCYLSPKNFGLEVFTIALLSTSNCIYIYIYIYTLF
jgi:hypothetical protein